MIEKKWSEIRDGDLNMALNSLARQKVPYKTTVKLLAIVKALESEQKKADKVAEALRDKYYKRNPEFNDKSPVGTAMYILKDEKDEKFKAEAMAAEKEFAETKSQFKTPKIKSSELENTELTAIELYKIEEFIEDDSTEGGRTGHLKPVEANA